MTYGEGLRWIFLIFMRDLHMNYQEISDLTYPQIYLLLETLRESNKAFNRQEYKKLMPFLNSRKI